MANRAPSPGGIYVGCARWSIPKDHVDRFPEEGSHLERYAARFPAVEINSSFYKPHRPATYARWAASVPPDFSFAVKVPKTAIHERRLADAGEILDRFLTGRGLFRRMPRSRSSRRASGELVDADR